VPKEKRAKNQDKKSKKHLNQHQFQ